MALHFIDPVKQFMTKQVFRNDYLVIEESCTTIGSTPISIKEQRLQQLCVAAGILNANECNRVHRRCGNPKTPLTSAATTLDLIQAYLPDYVRRTDSPKTLFNTDNKNHKNKLSLITSWLEVDDHRYLLELPTNIHALLIENDGALLAA